MILAALTEYEMGTTAVRPHQPQFRDTPTMLTRDMEVSIKAMEQTLTEMMISH